MNVPRQLISTTRKYIKDIDDIKYIHFRDLYKNIDSTNYQLCTKTDFKEIQDTCGNIFETWGRLKHSFGDKVTYEYRSKSGSKYFIVDNNVYRLSNHWGAVASCEWTLDGKGELMMSVMVSGDWQLGVANLNDFKVFRRKQDRKVDILLNPEWIEKMKPMVKVRDKLLSLRDSDSFKFIRNEDKQLIGMTYGMLSKELKVLEECA